ncbi:MAG TPA: GNAT family N-acetyltransferase [Candidatus Saccharibacteria bacterium]|nr:GNAT family N-acetyltransferase [Candidatus Saccharibacteria bacterium]
MATRLATYDDLAMITDLMNEFHSKPASQEDLSAQVKLIIDSKQSDILLVCNQEDAPVGMAIVNLIHKLPKVECRFNEIIVSEAARGQGYGAELLKACEDWAWMKNADLIQFTSRKSREQANNFYQKMGYTTRDSNVYERLRNVQ